MSQNSSQSLNSENTKISDGNVEHLSDPQVKWSTISFKWKVLNFLELPERTVNQYIRSPTFPEDLSTNGQWCLIIYPNGVDENAEGSVSLFVDRMHCTSSEIIAKLEFSIIDEDKKKLYTSPSLTHIFTQAHLSKGISKFVSRDILQKESNKLIKDGALMIFCEMSIVSDIIHPVRRAKLTRLPEIELLHDIELLYESCDCSDFRITVDDDEFLVHKAILAARSSVFSAMFKMKSEEGMEDCVDINDMDYEVVEGMLQFIYTGRVSNIRKIADGLLAAAEKYDLTGLRVLCVDALRTAITTENAANILILAQTHEDASLKAEAIDFICEHVKIVEKTEAFKSLIASHPFLLAETFSALAKRVNSEAVYCKKARREEHSDS